MKKKKKEKNKKKKKKKKKKKNEGNLVDHHHHHRQQLINSLNHSINHSLGGENKKKRILPDNSKIPRIYFHPRLHMAPDEGDVLSGVSAMTIFEALGTNAKQRKGNQGSGGNVEKIFKLAVNE
jgi:exoribonuclease R